MAVDLRGEICVCLPLRPIIAILTVVTFCVGVWHIIEITLGLVFDNEWGASADWAYANSCQGSACHDALRKQLLSCDGNRETSFKMRYITIGILGLIFGALGFQGVSGKNPTMTRTFAWYLVFLAILIATVCAADNAYVLACDSLSTNMQHDLGAWIPWKTVGLLRAQGHRDLSAFTANKLKELLGYDFLPLIFLCYVAVILIILYFAFATFRLARVFESGPVGLGANMLISCRADREITQMKERLFNVAVEHMSPLRHYDSFEQLQDANRFPYLTHHGHSPAMEYGSVGAARPPPPTKES